MARVAAHAAVASALVAAAVSPLRAQPPPPTIAQLDHSVWTVRDGAPLSVNVLAQSADGILWIGTTTGLYQFDGDHFEPFEPRAEETLRSLSVSALLAATDDALWIGYSRGGISRLAGSRLTSWPPGDGLPAGVVTALARGPEGDIWAATSSGLARYRLGRWERFGPESGYPGGFTSDLLVDRDGAVWAPATSGVFVLPRAASRFERRAPSLDPSGSGGGMPRQAPDGSIWGASITLGLTRLADASGAATSPAPAAKGLGEAWGLLLDRRGNAWVMDGVSLVHVSLSARTGDPPARPGAGPPLPWSRVPVTSGAQVSSLLEDREGNVWLGTSHGLERFRETKLTPVVFPRPIVKPALAPAVDGALWVGSHSDPLLIVDADGVARLAGAPRDISCAYRDLEGDLWLGGSAGLWHAAADSLSPEPRFTRIAPPIEMGRGDVQAIAVGLDGGLWVSLRGRDARGVYRRSGRTWSKVPSPPGLTEETASTIVADRSGRMWLGYPQSRLAVVGGGSTRVYGAADGLDVGTVSALFVRGGRVWVGGEHGVVLFDGARFRPLATSERLRGITGIVETSSGDLWCNGAGGVTYVAASEVARALQDPSHQARGERLDHHDGLDGQAPQIRPFPTAVQGTDGRLWFATDGGVAWIDPANVRRNPLPPPVLIRAVTAAGRRYEAGSQIALPPRTTDLTIAYTAPSLSMPDRVRFRHRLTGVGAGAAWEDAGARREARYANLGPGSYRFQVVAANEDGVWNEDGATVEIAIPATFTQTRGFVALCLAGAAASVWLLALWRQRRIARTLRAKFEVTLAERTRVARELHDTLLGDMAGVAMQLAASSRRVETAGANATLVGLLAGLGAQVQQALTEARRSVTAMRNSPVEPSSLIDRLSESAYRTFAGSGIAVEVERSGTPRPYPESVEAEVVRIATEAMTNARQHASCRRVEVWCSYGRRHLQVRLRDDGRGFDPHELLPTGHWGLVGMRERSAAIGARLAITSAPGAGTEVLLVVPASARRRRWRWTASARSQGR